MHKVNFGVTLKAAEMLIFKVLDWNIFEDM